MIENEKLEMKKNALQNELDTVRATFSENKEMLLQQIRIISDELESQKRNIDANNETLQQSITHQNDLNAMLFAERDAHSKLNENIVRFQSQIESKELEIEKLADSLRATSNELEAAKSKFESLDKLHNTTIGELEEARIAKTQAEVDAANVKHDMILMQQNVEILNEALENTKAEFSNIAKKLQNADTDLCQKTNDNSNLEASVKELTAKNSTLFERIEFLISEKQNASTTSEAFSLLKDNYMANVDALEKQKAALQSTICNQDFRIDEVKLEHEKTLLELESALKNITALQLRYDELVGTNSELKISLDMMADEKQKLLFSNAEMKNSIHILEHKEVKETEEQQTSTKLDVHETVVDELHAKIEELSAEIMNVNREKNELADENERQIEYKMSQWNSIAKRKESEYQNSIRLKDNQIATLKRELSNRFVEEPNSIFIDSNRKGISSSASTMRKARPSLMDIEKAKTKEVRKSDCVTADNVYEKLDLQSLMEADDCASKINDENVSVTQKSLKSLKARLKDRTNSQLPRSSSSKSASNAKNILPKRKFESSDTATRKQRMRKTELNDKQTDRNEHSLTELPEHDAIYDDADVSNCVAKTPKKEDTAKPSHLPRARTVSTRRISRNGDSLTSKQLPTHSVSLVKTKTTVEKVYSKNRSSSFANSRRQLATTPVEANTAPIHDSDDVLWK